MMKGEPRGNRIQVFEQSGALVDETLFAPSTLDSGSSFVPVLSNDPEQRWLYLAAGTDHKICILRWSDLAVVSEVGRDGRQLGRFLRPHGLRIHPRGNLDIGEASTGRRIQDSSSRIPRERTSSIFAGSRSGEWRMQSDAPPPSSNI